MSSEFTREICSPQKEQELLKLISKYRGQNKIKIGLNESIKAINKNKSLLTVIADDSVPKCITNCLIDLSESYGKPYKYVSDKSALGKALGLKVDVIACCFFCEDEEDDSKLYGELIKIL